MPPHIQLDHLSFTIASLCDGTRTLGEIKHRLLKNYDHSEAYVELALTQAMARFERAFAVFWSDSVKVSPRVLVSKAEMPISGFGLSAPVFVIWEVTIACNLACKHCLSACGGKGVGDVSTDTAKRIIDMLAELQVFTISFSGGEPMLRPDLFDLLTYASQKRVAIELLTNGTLVTPDIAKRLSESRLVNVQVSLDGLPNTHDQFRGVTGAYQSARRGIDILKNAGLNVAVSMTVHKKNVDEMSALVEQSINMGASMFKTTLFMPTGRGKRHEQGLVLSPDDVERFCRQINQKKEEVGEKIRISTEELYPWLLDKSIDEPQKTASWGNTFGCTAANSSFYISHDGKVAPCPFLQDFTAGDLTTNNAREIWIDAPVLKQFRTITREHLKGKCRTCRHLGMECFGGCRAAAYAYADDVFAEDPMCWHRLS
jgi:radical SAM protein with 4Fe4S-binding SPASM domain